MLGHAVQRAAIERAGLPFTSISRGRDYVSAHPRGTIDGVLGLTALFADRGIAADALDVLERWPADIVVVDCLLWGTLQALEEAAVPVVSLVHSSAAYFERNARGPVGLLARLRGADAARALRGTSGELVTTRADFEPGPRPDREVHTGFVWQGAPIEAVAQQRPQVLVSFSTTTFPGQARALQRVLDALGERPVDAIATTGAVDPSTLRAADNVRIERRIDHSELLPTTSLVIGHGGHATTARALGHGIPLLIMPMHPLMDQPAIGRAVQRLGVGAMLPKSASVSRIQAEVRRLLADSPVQDAARRFGVEVRERDGASVAADALHRLVQHGADDGSREHSGAEET